MKNTTARALSVKTGMASLIFGAVLSSAPLMAQAPPAALQAAVTGAQRPAADKARDQYRHPAETLAFLGVKPDATVVEIFPGGGYWTEILAPYLREHGHYIAAVGGHSDGLKAFTDKYTAKPDVYGKITVVALDPPSALTLAPAGSADFVLTFRNFHNWMKAGTTDAVFGAFAAALKPGGFLGVEEHRASTTKPQDPKAESGYVREDFVIALAKKAGFSLVGQSEVNANPKDTKDYAKGVWTLPPTLRLGEQDKAKYVAIGESDRMLLLFRKDLAAAKP